ncbi:MAG: hypothetical protein ACYTF0_03135, partial [Planctomycetota bacterium]
MSYRWLTPAAPAAIAVLRCPALPALFDRALPTAGRAVFARLRAVDGAVVDEVVISWIDEGQVEVGAHGGPGIRAAISTALHAHGLVEVVAAPAATGRWDRLAAAASPAAAAW